MAKTPTKAKRPLRRRGRRPGTVDLTAAPPTDNLAACLQAYDAASSDPRAAAAAYRRSMPRMDAVSVGEWATIVAQGIARKVLTGKEASTMLHAATLAKR